MKKLLFFILSAFLLSTKLMAWEQIPFTVNGDIDHMPIGHGYGRGPIEAPLVYIEDNTLSFEANHPKPTDGKKAYLLF